MTDNGTAAPAKPKTLKYLPAIDGMRGLFLMVVVVGHSLFLVRPVKGYIPGGYMVMPMFFVQSGFLITAVLLSEKAKTGTISFKNFYLRRALRLFPALYVMLAVHAFYFLFVEKKPFGIEARAVTSIGLYFSNVFQVFENIFPPFTEVSMPSELQHTWSLSMEEQFYILWPIALVWILKRFDGSKGSIPPILYVGIVLSALVRFGTTETLGFPAAYVLLTDHLDGIFIGVAIAFLWRDDRLPKRGIKPLAWLSFVVIWIYMFVIPADSKFPYWGGFTLFGLMTATIMIAIIDTDWSVNRLFSLRPIAWLGKTAYGAYVWHPIILHIVGSRMAGRPTGLIIAVYLVVTYIVVALSWKFVEQPFIRLKLARFSVKPKSAEPALTNEADVAPVPADASVPADAPTKLVVEGATS